MKKKLLSLTVTALLCASASLGFADDMQSTQVGGKQVLEATDTQLSQTLLAQSAVLKAESGSQAQAENSTQAAKQLNLGQASVNPQTGQASATFPLPSFGGINLSLSYSGLASQYTAPFYLPNGVYLMGIPFIHNSGQSSVDAVNINGQDYYIDAKYNSAEVDDNGQPTGEYYYSGLKYQTSKNIQFKDYRKSSSDKRPTLNIHTKDGTQKQLQVYAELIILDNQGGQLTYIFDENGFCVALTDKYFKNNTDNNYKHLTQMLYQDSLTDDVYSTKLDKIIDSNGKELSFNYANGDREITLTYPIGASGEAYKAYIQRQSSTIVLGHSLNEQYDYQFNLDQTSGLSRVEENLFDKKSNQVTTNKVYTFTYTDQLVSRFDVQDGHNTKNRITTYYQYNGDRQHTFQYGFDQAYDAPDINVLKPAYSTVIETATGKTIQQYNALSQNIQTDQLSLKDELILSIYNLYPANVVYDEQTRTNRLLTNFQAPIEQLSVLYDKDASGKAVATAVKKSKTIMGNYGQQLKTQDYPIVAFKGYQSSGDGIKPPVYDSDISPIEATTSYYDEEHFMTPVKEESVDYTTNRTQIKEAILTPDGLNIAKSLAKVIQNGQEKHLQTTEYSYATDTTACQNSNIALADMICSESTYFEDHPDKRVVSLYDYQLANHDAKQYGALKTRTTVQATGDGDIPESTSQETSIAGLTIETIDPAGLTSHASYDVSGNLLTKIDPTGVTEKRIYDYINRTYKSEIIDNTGQQTLLNSEKVIDFINHVLYEKELSEKNNKPDHYIVGQNTYDYAQNGRLVKQVDENGNEVEISYDAYRGNVSEKRTYQKSASGAREFFGSQTQQFSVECSNDYNDSAISDKLCYVVAEMQQGGEHGQKTVARGLSKDVIYEQVEYVNNHIKSKVKNGYTLSGELLSTITYKPSSKDGLTEYQNKTYHYDVLGRLIEESQKVYKDGSIVKDFVTQYQYDPWNLDKQTLQTFKTATGNYKSYQAVYNILGQQVQKCYDVNGKQLCAQMVYDNAGRLSQAIDFAHNKSKSLYDQTTGLLDQQQYLDSTGSLQDTIHSFYDNFARNYKQTANDDYTISQVFNEIGLPKQLKLQAGKNAVNVNQASVIYDDQNRIAQYTDYNGFIFVNHYNASGDMSRVDIYAPNTTDFSPSNVIGFQSLEYYGYDEAYPLQANQIKKISSQFDYNGIHYADVSTTEYDDQGRMIKQESDDGNQVLTTLYTYNALDQVTAKQTTTQVLNSDAAQAINQTEHYTYNVLNQLIASTSEGSLGNSRVTYSYDDNGNMLSQSSVKDGKTITKNYVYNNVNQLLVQTITTEEANGATSEEIHYSYDDNGNLSKEQNISTGDIKNYTFNAQNQMVSVSTDKGVFHYAYYPTGQRALKQSADQAIVYLYSLSGRMNNSLLLQDNQASKLDSYFGAFRYIHDLNNNADSELQMGSMRLNKSNRTMIAQSSKGISYEIQDISNYGKVLPLTTTDDTSNDILGYMQYPYLYGAAYYDQETGLQYMNARYYSPELSRFISMDNADYEDNPNRYIYALSNPIMYLDQDGHSAATDVLNGIMSVVVISLAVGLMPETAGVGSVMIAGAVGGIVEDAAGQSIELTAGEKEKFSWQESGYSALAGAVVGGVTKKGPKLWKDWQQSRAARQEERSLLKKVQTIRENESASLLKKNEMIRTYEEKWSKWNNNELFTIRGYSGELEEDFYEGFDYSSAYKENLTGPENLSVKQIPFKPKGESYMHFTGKFSRNVVKNFGAFDWEAQVNRQIAELSKYYRKNPKIFLKVKEQRLAKMGKINM